MQSFSKGGIVDYRKTGLFKWRRIWDSG
jgi:hypothetical protein